MNGRGLTLDDRLRIEQLLNRNICNAYIARAIGRVPSVVYNEVKRAGGKENYTAKRAHEIACAAFQSLQIPAREKVLKDLKERSKVIGSTNIKEQVKVLLDQLQTFTINLGKLYDNLPGETT